MIGLNDASIGYWSTSCRVTVVIFIYKVGAYSKNYTRNMTTISGDKDHASVDLFLKMIINLSDRYLLFIQLPYPNK